MIRYNNIPGVDPGEPLSASLINQIIGMANNARFASGDGTIDVTQVGNTLGFSTGVRRPNSDADIFVMIQGLQDKDQRAPRNSTNNILIGGMYYGNFFTQPSALFFTEETPAGQVTLTPTPVPSPPKITCLVVNLAELDGRQYPVTSANINNITNYGTNLILSNTTAVGRYVGTTSQGVPVIVVNVPVFKPVTCSITGSAGSGGQYTVTILSSTPYVEQTATSSVYSTVHNYGTAGTTGRMSNCLLINLPEKTATSNSLSVGSLVASFMAGQTAQPRYTPILYSNSGSGGGVSFGRITSVAGTTNATTWTYNASLSDGSSVTGYNGLEWNGTSPSMIQGSPGSLGVAVGTNGSVTGTSCFVKPLGPTGFVPFFYDVSSGHWTFALTNSAG